MFKLKNALFVTAHLVTLALILNQGRLFVELLWLEDSNESIETVRVDQTVIPVKKTPDINSLVEANIFGIPVGEAPKPAVKIEQAAPSTKPYRIAGIAFNKGSETASVVMEVRPGDFGFFKHGDEIEPGVSLTSISDKAVLLDVSGRAERVEYVGVRQPVLIRVQEKERGLEQASKSVDWTWASEWNQLSNEIILKKMGLAYVEGRYVIEAGSLLLNNWSVSPGDVLLSVNGVSLVKGSTPKEVLRPLSRLDTVHLLLENSRRRNLVRWRRDV